MRQPRIIALVANSWMLLSLDVSGQVEPPAVEWEQTFRLTAAQHVGEGGSVQQTVDGGYIFSGDTRGRIDGDFYLLKTDKSGNLDWERTLGREDRNEGEASVRQTKEDGGYILAGWCAGTADDICLLKTDSSGTVIWERQFDGGDEDWVDSDNSVRQTADGDYIVAGGTGSSGAGGWDVLLIKTDEWGYILWQQTFGGTRSESAYAVEQTTDGGYVVAGWTESFGAGSRDIYLIKTDGTGKAIWETTFGGEESEAAHSVQQTNDGGYIVVGYTTSFGADIQVYAVKTDEIGGFLWENTFSGLGRAGGMSVRNTRDGGYIIAGVTATGFSWEGGDMYLIKIDEEGKLVWESILGGEGYEDARSVQQTTDGGYIVGGVSSSSGPEGNRVYLVKLAPEASLKVLFRRGDSNADGDLNLSDSVFSLNYLFLEGPSPGCLDAADVNDSGDLDLTDGVHVLNYLFLSGPAPTEPFGTCGPDPTSDGLSCDTHAYCSEG